MNDGKLTDEEIRLVGRTIDIMKSALEGNRFIALKRSIRLDMPEIAYILNGEGKTLQADVESGAAVFEGKLEGTINGRPFEFVFKPNGGNPFVENTSKLSDIEIKGIEFGFNYMKNALRIGKSSS